MIQRNFAYILHESFYIWENTFLLYIDFLFYKMYLTLLDTIMGDR